MRIVAISLAGMAASLALFGLSQLADGFVGAAAYMLALLIAPMTIGVAIATAVNRRLDQPEGLLLRRRWSAGRPAADDAPLCGGCGARKIAMDFAWLCSACDLVPARR